MTNDINTVQSHMINDSIDVSQSIQKQPDTASLSSAVTVTLSYDTGLWMEMIYGNRLTPNLVLFH